MSVQLLGREEPGLGAERLSQWRGGLSVLHPEQLQSRGLPLYVAYLLWIAVVAILYPLCRWCADGRRRCRDWWLSYL
jgi:hypothetical protein